MREKTVIVCWILLKLYLICWTKCYEMQKRQWEDIDLIEWKGMKMLLILICMLKSSWFADLIECWCSEILLSVEMIIKDNWTNASLNLKLIVNELLTVKGLFDWFVIWLFIEKDFQICRNPPESLICVCWKPSWRNVSDCNKGNWLSVIEPPELNVILVIDCIIVCCWL